MLDRLLWRQTPDVATCSRWCLPALSALPGGQLSSGGAVHECSIGCSRSTGCCSSSHTQQKPSLHALCLQLTHRMCRRR